MVADRDHSGNDIGERLTTGGTDAVRAQCDQWLNCDGFNSLGYTKNAVFNPTVSPGVCLYTRRVADFFPGYRLLAQSTPAAPIPEEYRLLTDTDTIMSLRKMGPDGRWLLISADSGTWGGKVPMFPSGVPFIGLQYRGARVGFDFDQAVVGKQHRFVVTYGRRMNREDQEPRLSMGFPWYRRGVCAPPIQSVCPCIRPVWLAVGGFV